jgi:alkylation response protein AidB-like acyl-CoA dehydrogenase
MDFNLSPEHVDFRATVRAFAATRLKPLAASWDSDATPLPRDVRAELADLGLLGITLPERYGGTGAPLIFACLAIEELARVSQSAAWAVFEASVGPSRILERFGTPEQCERWLPAIVSGERTMALSISEANAGSAATDLRTSARIDGDEIVVDGAKQWCSGSTEASDYMVYVRMSDDPGARGIGAVVVPGDTPGLEFGPLRHYMGMRTIPHADMFFSDCRTPRQNLVLPAGSFSKLFEAFSIERIGNSCMSLGCAAAALDAAVAYVTERQQFGRELVEFQAIQTTIADMVMRVEAARMLVWRAASNAGTGIPSALESSVAKCYSNETAKFVCDSALGLMGATGYSDDNEVERHLRDSYGWPIAGGTPTMQRLRIASEFLGRRFDQRLGSKAGSV